MRTNRGGSSRSSQPTPEQITISFTPLSGKSLQVIQGAREKWATFITKYEASELTGAAQAAAVVEGFTNAHWSEKPKPEDLAPALGAAIGDILKAQGSVDWVLAEGTTICLVSPNGKVAVAPVAIATKWLSSRKNPLDKLGGEVAQAVRDTTGEPVLIGFDDEEDESGDIELR